MKTLPMRTWSGRFAGNGMQSDRFDDESTAQKGSRRDMLPANSRYGCNLPTKEDDYESMSGPVKVSYRTSICGKGDKHAEA
jgi:hypothetical protein